MSSINDLLTSTENGEPPQATTASAIRSPGSNTLQAVALTDWPTVTAIHFVTGTPMTDALGNQIINPATLCLWKGIVSGSNINNLTLRYSATGSDPGNQIGDIIEMAPTSSWANDLYEGLVAEHTTQGGHTSGMTVDGNGANLLTNWITVAESWTYASSTSINVPSGAKYQVGDFIQFTQSASIKYFIVTGIASNMLTLSGINGVTVANSAISSPGYSRARNPFGTGLNGATPFNPHKFSVYRSATLLVPPAGNLTPLIYDTKEYDTGSDYNTTTGLFTAAVAGLYKFVANIYVGAVNGDQVFLNFLKNGSIVKAGPVMNNSTGGTNNMSSGPVVTPPLQLAAADTISIQIGHSLSYNLGLSTGSALLYFGGELLSLI